MANPQVCDSFTSLISSAGGSCNCVSPDGDSNCESLRRRVELEKSSPNPASNDKDLANEP
ncbi:hypothetical protein N7488_004705 [Penicillium malachiteum]|nr:hypothetical protein N7488_004705 [Penicillium malachiteum]